jgi:hypothetical protein
MKTQPIFIKNKKEKVQQLYRVRRQLLRLLLKRMILS